MAVPGNLEDGEVSLEEHVKRLDATAAMFVEVVQALKEQHGGNTQTIVHHQAGMSVWGAVAVTSCIFTFLGLILFSLVVIPELHDLRAWSDIFRSKIYALEKPK